MPQHVFFDLDNTLMLSRTPMRESHRRLFKKLCDAKDMVVVSGAEERQIKRQIPSSIDASYFILAQTGNHALDQNGNLLWKESFSHAQTEATLAFIETLKRQLAIAPKDPNDLVELRGAQISYSPIGHHEELQKKYAFDPDQGMRRRVLKNHAAEVEKLSGIGVEVVPGGTTCFDFFLKGKNKGFNVARLLEREGWHKADCLYVGDALFPGGNDETVIGVIPTHAVKNPDETFAFIAKALIPDIVRDS